MFIIELHKIRLRWWSSTKINVVVLHIGMYFSYNMKLHLGACFKSFCGSLLVRNK